MPPRIRRHPRRPGRLVGLAVLLAGTTARAAKPSEPDIGIWNQIMVELNLDAKAKGLRLFFDFHLRRMNSPLQYVRDMSGAIVETKQNPNTFVVVRPAIGYMWAKWGGFFVGYIWLPDFFDDPVFARTRNIDEHRIYEQLTLRWAWEGRLDINWRNRVEHRIRTHGPGSDDIVDGVPQDMGLGRWAHRFRQQLRIAVNFKKDVPWQFLVYDEFFFHLTRTAYTQPGFDQNRLFVGLAYDTKAMRVEFGYLNQYIHRPRDPDNNNHLLSLAFIIKLAPGQKAKPPATPAAAPAKR
ncbi:DUF2490 domain-containing protein [Nannocystis sp. SCPEA4]|uniref:DUF2490 domain-containing protein n=1 Tax=Nannocystis sp. SCPEA4 TaxID=2996787 RepID=UPI00227005BC|nr:DUF2490 domain-containing protein [Nannocystis sp. SCPEA4]MCY1061669.1 DUF2490 domain-containing protein [Nannocystis sp. SCPEA4]